MTAIVREYGCRFLDIRHTSHFVRSFLCKLSKRPKNNCKTPCKKRVILLTFYFEFCTMMLVSIMKPFMNFFKEEDP